MGKMNELKTTHDFVKEVLETIPMARNSDMVLYVKVCEMINPLVLNKPFWYVLLNLKEFNVPCFETVRRARQKIQAENPDLSGNSAVECQRVLNEEIFREYARR